ncbi:hypothetical protein GCM10023063_07650 [Arthrobacter methylotrophus]
MANQGVERISLQALQLEIYRTACNAEMIDHAVIPQPNERCKRTAMRRCWFKAELFGFTQQDEREKVEAKALKAPFHGAHNAVPRAAG